MEVQRKNEAIAADAGGVDEKVDLRNESPGQGQARTPFLLPIVFVSGMAVMATEMCASRLIQPFFGDSLLIWANLIGFIMIYLTAGYFLGGRLADRFPRPSFLYQLTAWAAFAIGLIPVLSNPILTLSNEGFRNVDGGLFFGSLAGIILLFSVPLILLGCVSPFAIRLRVNGVGSAGKTAGAISSLSTLGSILGTFLPVLVIIPWVGTRATLYIFAVTLLAFSLLGLYLSKRSRVPFYALQLVVVLLLGFLITTNIIKAPIDGQLLYQKESSFNYIQVVRPNYNPDQINLVLNEGHAIHSIYNPKQLLTGGPWDYYMVAPFFSGLNEKTFNSALIIGLGAGTVPKQITKAYGTQVQIDGAELDPEIIKVGREYFDMNEPNLNAIAQDGRYFLMTSPKKYDLIGMDAYRQPYIPFHLTTKEFFQQVKDHLTPNGVAVVNAGAPIVSGKQDTRLAEVLSSTMKTVYPNVYMIKLNGLSNILLVGTNQPTNITDASFQQIIAANATNPLIKQVAQTIQDRGQIVEWTKPDMVFTDDWAPIERVIDQIILDYVTGGGK
jgi:spermidine synthase